VHGLLKCGAKCLGSALISSNHIWDEDSLKIVSGDTLAIEGCFLSLFLKKEVPGTGRVPGGAQGQDLVLEWLRPPLLTKLLFASKNYLEHLSVRNILVFNILSIRFDGGIY
jgi:hypothetical protein